VSAVFFVTYLLVFKIGMLNMFIAIIVAHYNEFRRDYQSDKNVSFIEVVHKIIKANMFKDGKTVESKQLADQ
jgi:hypothetical protein